MNVEPIDFRVAYADLNRTSMSGSELSEATRIVLRRNALLELYRTSPNAVIAALRDQSISRGMPWRDLFALSELYYALGCKSRSRSDFLASAVYAYAVLFPGGDAERPEPYSAQFRQAFDFYNLALTQALAIPGGGAVTLRDGRSDLPFGSIDITVDTANMHAGGRRLATFLPTMNLSVQGFANNYRSDGLGAPLAASLVSDDEQEAKQTAGLEFPPHLRIPSAAILQIANPRQQLATTALQAKLSVYTIYDTARVRIGAYDVPVEYDQTAVRAITLTENHGWTTEIGGLFNDDRFGKSQTGRLFAIAPHRPGRIPVVLVHGTASSPFRWADMYNDLLENQTIRDNYEFWLFSYATGNPIPISALMLRQALENAVHSFGGLASDPALGRMVVIGHSQGGLLTKLLTVETGAKIWDVISDRPLESLELSPETRELLHTSLFLHPLSAIETVVFIATPHRGSFLAGFSLAGVVEQFISLPVALASAGSELLAKNSRSIRLAPSNTEFNSLSGMSPKNPMLLALAEIPVSPRIHAHSIIPELGTGRLEMRDDGVVKYESAHIEGVESELIVQSGHSVEANPLAVAEVQRILLEQLSRRHPGPTTSKTIHTNR